MGPLAASLLSVLVVSAISLVGLGVLGVRPDRVQALAGHLVAFAAGALLGDAFIHLIPETFQGTRAPLGPSLLVLGGIVLFFFVEKLLRGRDSAGIPTLAVINVVGDGVHNFIDGAVIAASYLVSPTLGVTTTLAVVAHEIPQELGDFGVLVHSGLGVRRAVLLNLASALTAFLGALATLAAGAALGGAVTDALVPITGGGFVYIAAADLVPELQRDRTLRGALIQGALLAAGIAGMAALTRLEGG